MFQERKKEFFLPLLIVAVFLWGETLPFSFWWLAFFFLVFFLQYRLSSRDKEVAFLRGVSFLSAGLANLLFEGLLAYFFLILFGCFYLLAPRLTRSEITKDWWLPWFNFFLFAELFFLASAFEWALLLAWVLFFLYLYSIRRFYWSSGKKIVWLIFSFVLSQLFLFLYFLPFGSFTAAALTLLFFSGSLNFLFNRFEPRLILGLVLAFLALLASTGMKPKS